MKPTWLEPFSLKWDPFAQEVPVEALLATPAIEHFCRRIERTHIREGGFALVVGEPGVGKSVTLRLLAERLEQLPEVSVGALVHPQCNLADFYRELGDLFSIPLRPHNRWNGFKALRECWHAHMDRRLTRPVLLVDEAQQMSPVVLSELRLLSSARFDSRSLLSVVLAGDRRLLEKLQSTELLPLDSRIRIRLRLEPASTEELVGCLRHLMATAGNPRLMSEEVIEALAEHALGNRRTLTQLAADLLVAASERELSKIDQKLYLELTTHERPVPRAVRERHRRR
jgi:general secretion pathway protein A